MRAPREDLDVRTVWVLSGVEPRPVRIRIGITDGSATEVTEGELQAGDQLVTEVVGGEADKPPAVAPPGGGQQPGGGLRRVF
jgi:HlyD family secretion protein